jgi:hypothetical protein
MVGASDAITAAAETAAPHVGQMPPTAGRSLPHCPQDMEAAIMRPDALG